jgi:hypothetical protein
MVMVVGYSTILGRSLDNDIGSLNFRNYWHITWRWKMKRLNELSEKQKEIKAEMAATALTNLKPALLEGAQELFERVPKLEKIKWTQGTPGFNDGDPCLFRIDSCEFFNGKGAELCSYHKNITEEESSILGKFELAINNLENLLEIAFDGDAEVTITRDLEVEVEEYSCGY